MQQDIKPERPGQPTKYRIEYCEALINHMKQGFSYESFASELNVAWSTLYNWEDAHPEFLEAKKVGTAHALSYWEKIMQAGTVGKIEKFNVTGGIFMMKNRFNHLYRDKHEVEHTGVLKTVSGYEALKLELLKNIKEGMIGSAQETRLIAEPGTDSSGHDQGSIPGQSLLNSQEPFGLQRDHTENSLGDNSSPSVPDQAQADMRSTWNIQEHDRSNQLLDMEPTEESESQNTD